MMWAFWLILCLAGTTALAKCTEEDDGQRLTCTVRNLQGSLPVASDLRSLRLTCDDLFYTASTLSRRHFGALPLLEELTVSRCDLREVSTGAFEGLQGLQRLSLEGRGESVAEMHPDTFQGMEPI